MTETRGPFQWAYRLTHILNESLGADHFPVDVKMVAKDFSISLFPDDPISAIMSDSLPGFEGALIRDPNNQKGWAIVYNRDVRSVGRINFTLAHEFGHYLIHRLEGPPEFHCTSRDTYRWDDGYGQMEREANEFAANFLMPLDDFRRQLPADITPSIDLISSCSERYGVSFMAACLRWISYTSVPAVFVVSRDGFIDWARSSKSAMKLGAFFRTSKTTNEVPPGALALAPLDASARSGVRLPVSVWFNRECIEMAFSADAYDFIFSIILIGEREDCDISDL